MTRTPVKVMVATFQGPYRVTTVLDMTRMSQYTVDATYELQDKVTPVPGIVAIIKGMDEINPVSDILTMFPVTDEVTQVPDIVVMLHGSCEIS